jgi:hypothetical protein
LSDYPLITLKGGEQMTETELQEMFLADIKATIKDFNELEVEDFNPASLPPVPFVLALILYNGCTWDDYLAASIDWKCNPSVAFVSASHFPELNCSYFICLASIKAMGLSLPPLP